MQPAPQPSRNSLTAFYRSAEAIRSRSVSGVLLTGTLNIPTPPARLAADWERDIATQLGLEPGDVEQLPLARARLRWPDYKHCVQAMQDWTQGLALADVLTKSEVALMACRGAKYHHDVGQYGGAAFCNLFMSEDKGLDLHFPHAGVRIPLVRGTAVVFDTGQPHAVIKRQSNGFNSADFAPHEDCSLVFLTWELPIEDALVAGPLQIAFDVAPSIALKATAEQLWLGAAPAHVHPESGQWCPVPPI